MKNHQQFFEKALAIQAQRQEKLTEAEKKEIALELGFSEEDWQAVLDSFRSHLDRGTEFLKRHNYEKAIVELEDALVLQPEHAETLAALAQAYLGEFQTKKRRHLKEKALQYAQECLLYSPKNQDAHQVIDYFNPNQVQTYSPKSQPYTAPKAVKPKAQKEEKPLRHMGTIMWGGMAFGLLLGLYLEVVKPYLKKQKQQQPKITHSDPSPPIIEYDSKQAVDFQLETTLPEVLQKRGYRFAQTDSITWRLSTAVDAPLLEIKLREHFWWHRKEKEARTGKKSEWDLFWGDLEVKTLCDSIRYEALLFQLDLLDEEKAYLSSYNIRVGETEVNKDFLPNKYYFKTNEVSTLYLRLGSAQLAPEKREKYLGKKPARVVLRMQSLHLSAPPKLEVKPLALKPNPNIPNPPVKIEVLDEIFFSEPGSPYTLHLWVWKVHNLHPEKTLGALSVRIKYYDKNKQLIKEEGEWLATNLDLLPPASERIHRFRVPLNENYHKDPPVIIKEEDIAYKEVEIGELKWE